LAEGHAGRSKGEEPMSPQQIDVKEAQARLYELLSQGVAWILIERFVPVARRVLLSSCVAGLHQGAIQTSPDSDKPLPEEFWTGEL